MDWQAVNVANLTVQLTYSDDLQTSLLMAAVRVRDAAQETTVYDEELRMAIVRLSDVLQGVGERLGIETHVERSKD